MLKKLKMTKKTMIIVGSVVAGSAIALGVGLGVGLKSDSFSLENYLGTNAQWRKNNTFAYYDSYDGNLSNTLVKIKPAKLTGFSEFSETYHSETGETLSKQTVETKNKDFRFYIKFVAKRDVRDPSVSSFVTHIVYFNIPNERRIDSIDIIYFNNSTLTKKTNELIPVSALPNVKGYTWDPDSVNYIIYETVVNSDKTKITVTPYTKENFNKLAVGTKFIYYFNATLDTNSYTSGYTSIGFYGVGQVG